MDTQNQSEGGRETYKQIERHTKTWRQGTWIKRVRETSRKGDMCTVRHGETGAERQIERETWIQRDRTTRRKGYWEKEIHKDINTERHGNRQ